MTHHSPPSPTATYTGDAFAGRAISEITTEPGNPQSIWVSSTRAVRGVSSVTGNATSTPPPPRPPFGLFHSTDGGQTFNFVWDGNGTLPWHQPRRTRSEQPQHPVRNAVLAGHLALRQRRRHLDADQGAAAPAERRQRGPRGDRRHEAVKRQHAAIPGPGRFRPGAGEPPAEVWRTDNAQHATTTSGWINLTTNRTSNYCTGQCWYDNFVVTPRGHPNWVYVGGSYLYADTDSPATAAPSCTPRTPARRGAT